jgi:hypothetical protein
MATLNDLLNDLGTNAELAASWEKDPEGVMKHYTLSDDERRAMIQGDIEELKRASGLTSLRMTNGTVRSHDTDL